MKKLQHILTILILFTLVGCSSNNGSFSEKISYLPILPESTLISFTPNDDVPNEIIYSVKKDSIEEAITAYKNSFEKADWKIDEESSQNNTIKYTKDSHFAIVIFSNLDSEIQYTIVTK